MVDFVFEDGTPAPEAYVENYMQRVREVMVDHTLPTIDGGYAARAPEWDGALSGCPVLLEFCGSPLGVNAEQELLTAYGVREHRLTRLMAAVNTMPVGAVLLGVTRSWARLRLAEGIEDTDLLGVVYAAEFNRCPVQSEQRWCVTEEQRRLYAVDTFQEVYRYTRGRDSGEVELFHQFQGRFDHPDKCHDAAEFEAIRSLVALAAVSTVPLTSVRMFLSELDRLQPYAIIAEREMHERAGSVPE